ncbi:MAG: sigma-70 family RNA polymerase sigma factor [Calditrichaeota bacterium]|nr:sigma-70 family RNA polymerase sigma factor [Calditrichota bacterium]
MSRQNGSQPKPTQVDITMGALKNLDNHERILVALYYYEGLTPEEISELLGKDARNIQQQLDQIHAKIAHFLQVEEASSVLTARVYG